MSFPGAVYNENPEVAPLESEDVPASTGFGANVRASYVGTLGVSLLNKGVSAGMAAANVQDTAVPIPYDEAVARMKAEKLDPSVFAKDQPVTTGYLRDVMAQQLSIQKNRDLAERAHLGTASTFASSLIGGSGDPIFLALGPVVGRGTAVVEGALGIEGLPLAARVGKGAAEGGTALGVYTKGEQQFGTAQGDPDITSNDVLRGVLWGGAFGGALNGVLGARPTPPADISPYLSMIRTGEGSAAAAKALGVPEHEVVSAKGAVGTYQVTPETAKQYGFDPAKLSDPAYNEKAATAILSDLHKQFGDDPEAIAIGYNAGPGMARRFLRAGRDHSMLPKETQDYLARIEAGKAAPEGAPPGLDPETQQAAGKTAAVQMANDSTVNVEPVVKPEEGADLSDAIPKPGSTITEEPETAARLEQMAKPKPAPAPEATPEANPELADLQAQTTAVVREAQEAHEIMHPTVEGEAEPVQSPYAKQIEDEKATTENDDVLAKATEAALRCAVLRGFD